MRVVFLLTALILGLVCAWPDSPCRTPPGAANYTIEHYSGRWFEIGKIQTAGGAYFEKDCVCTHLDVGQNPQDPSEVIVSNICNKKTPVGELLIANGTLTSSRNPADGRYNETIGPVSKAVSYNIIALVTDEYSVEYDCGAEFGFTNYCVHILSRQPTLNTTIINNLLQLAQQYDLNPVKLDFVLTKQANCTYAPQRNHRHKSFAVSNFSYERSLLFKFISKLPIE